MLMPQISLHLLEIKLLTLQLTHSNRKVRGSVLFRLNCMVSNVWKGKEKCKSSLWNILIGSFLTDFKRQQLAIFSLFRHSSSSYKRPHTLASSFAPSPCTSCSLNQTPRQENIHQDVLGAIPFSNTGQESWVRSRDWCHCKYLLSWPE